MEFNALNCSQSPPSPLQEVAAFLRHRMRMKIDFLHDLPPELSLHILQFLEAEDLSSCTKVSSKWHHLAHEEALWKQICEKRWKNKLHKKLELPKEVEEMIENPSGSSSLLAPHSLPRLGFSLWKCSYLLAEKDAFRSAITIEELCNFKWKFEFRFWSPLATTDQRPQFHSDGSFTSLLHPNSLRWQYTEDGNIQVANYPALVPMRTANWGWMLVNQYVSFTSIDDTKKINEEENIKLLLL